MLIPFSSTKYHFIEYFTFAVASKSSLKHFVHIRVFSIKEYETQDFYRCYRTLEIVRRPSFMLYSAKDKTIVTCHDSYGFGLCINDAMTFTKHFPYIGLPTIGSSVSKTLNNHDTVWISGGIPVYPKSVNKTALPINDIVYFSTQRLEFQDASFKLPLARAKHCSINMGNNQMFVYGGITNPNSSKITQIRTSDNKWINVSLFTCYAPMPLTCHVKQVTGNPCPQTTEPNSVITCGAVYDEYDIDIIIPTHSNQEACTAIFHWSSHKWSKLPYDNRETYEGGQIIMFANNTRLLYIGGIHVKTKTLLRTIYEYQGINNLWRLWDKKLPTDLEPELFTQVPNDFCLKSKDVKKMYELDPQGELKETDTS